MSETNPASCNWDEDPFLDDDWANLDIEGVLLKKIQVLEHLHLLEAHMAVCPVDNSAQAINEARTHRSLEQDIWLLDSQYWRLKNPEEYEKQMKEMFG
jgi:hypothetical protein